MSDTRGEKPIVDERELIEFETPYVLAEAFPARIGAAAGQRRCSQCGSQSQASPASQLTVVKHRHATQPLGHLRLYCREHAPGAKEWSSGASGSGGNAGPTCPQCFVTVPSGTRVCDTCGTSVN